VLSVLASPVASMKHAAADVRAFFATNRLNHTLKAENDSLRHWQATALALKAENEALRRLSEYQPVEGVSFVTARVLASSMGDFSQSLTLNVGSDDGVTNLAPVVDAYGVIGRVVDVTKKASRVLLITDVASRLPVVTAHSRQRAILTGTGSELMRLRYLSGTGAPTLGEAVATTHEGGLVPGGIAVGTVFKQDEAGYLIKPLRPVASAEYVRVVLFSDGSR
jgi:rod shape-determining protein MreC